MPDPAQPAGHLLEWIWVYDKSVETRSVDVHVGRLRAKLGPAGEQIETLVGMGYRFVGRSSSDPPAASRGARGFRPPA